MPCYLNSREDYSDHQIVSVSRRRLDALLLLSENVSFDLVEFQSPEGD